MKIGKFIISDCFLINFFQIFLTNYFTILALFDIIIIFLLLSVEEFHKYQLPISKILIGY